MDSCSAAVPVGWARLADLKPTWEIMLCSYLKERARHGSVLMRRNCSDVRDWQGILRYVYLYSARHRKKHCGSLRSWYCQTSD